MHANKDDAVEEAQNSISIFSLSFLVL